MKIPEETLGFFGGDELRARIFLEKYALRDEEGKVLEKTPKEMWHRVSEEIAGVEKDKHIWKENFYWLLEDFKFIPGGRILFGAGNPRKVTLLNCYVLPIKEDSIEGIFDCLKEMARTYSFGGGVGIDISMLRPKGAKVNNAAMFSTGSVSFMEIFSLTTGTIGQAGRRGALMLTIHCQHPDIEDFIDIKNDPEQSNVRFANISVLVTDEFIKAVKSGKDWYLWYPDKCEKREIIKEVFNNRTTEFESFISNIESINERYIRGYIPMYKAVREIESINGKLNNCYIIFHGSTLPYYRNKEYYIFVGPYGIEFRKKRIYKRVKADYLWDKIVTSAWSSAEPGVIFISRIKEFSTTEYNGMEVLTVNPCSEIPLQAYGCCCLGNINLSYFVKDPFGASPEVDFINLERALRYAVRFLDDVLTYNENKHPLKEQDNYSRWSRRIGVGFTGLGDMLAKLKIVYGSRKSVEFLDDLFDWIKHIVYDESSELAEEKGTFPAFEANIHLSQAFFKGFKEDLLNKIRKKGLRNSALLTVPPVGSGSLLAGVSSGIEPIFSLYYIRRTESVSGKGEYKIYHWLVKEYLERFNISKDEFESNKPDFFITAYEIDPIARVEVQATIQKHIDHSISSTVNLPEDSRKEDVERIYLKAWEEGCKSITVYREGSREGILIKGEKRVYSFILENGFVINAFDDDIVVYKGKEYKAGELYREIEQRYFN